MDTVGKRLEKCPMEIRYAYQELHKLPEGFTVPEGRVKPWGTSHAVLCAAEVIGDAPFAVINADDYYGPSAFKVIYDYLVNAEDTDKYNYCMVGYRLGNTVTENGSVARGVCATDENGYLTDIVERTKIEQQADTIRFTEDDGATWTEIAADTPVSMNMWGYTGSFLKEIKARFPKFLTESIPVNPLKCEMYLPMTVGELLSENKATVQVLRCDAKWYGVTYAADKPVVVEALKGMTESGLYPDGLWK